jgi:hypothetical protein
MLIFLQKLKNVDFDLHLFSRKFAFLNSQKNRKKIKDVKVYLGIIGSEPSLNVMLSFLT